MVSLEFFYGYSIGSLTKRGKSIAYGDKENLFTKRVFLMLWSYTYRIMIIVVSSYGGQEQN